MGFDRHRVDEELHSQVAPDRGFGFSETTHSIDGVSLNAIEIIFSLRIDGAKDRISIGLPVHMRDPPVVADDRDVAGPLLPPRHVGVLITRSGCSHTDW